MTNAYKLQNTKQLSYKLLPEIWQCSQPLSISNSAMFDSIST